MGGGAAVTSYDACGSHHGVVSVEAVLGAAVVVVAVAAPGLGGQLVAHGAVRDQVVGGLALVAALGQRAVRALGRYVVGEVAAVVTPATRG